MTPNAYKNADGNSKFHITKWNPWKLTWKEPIIAEDKIKVNVILANTYKVTAKNSFRSFNFLSSFYGK